ncbi:MAG: MFS transporter [Spirochaetota bacterium]
MGRRTRGPRSSFGLTGNARVCTLLLPLFGVPFSFYFFYLSLYLREEGVGDAGFGTLMLVGSAASVLFSLVAAPLVDRMGRKRSTLLFSIASSALPPLVFALSGSFAFAFFAFVLTGMNKIMSVGYYLLMSEDADDRQRVTAFNLFNVVLVAAGMFVPLSSGFVDRFGLVAVERFFLWFSFVSMTALAIVRDRLVVETSVGLAVMERCRTEGAWYKGLTRPFGVASRFLLAKPLAMAAMLANVLFYVYYIVGTNNSLYFTPYFGDALGLDTSIAATLGAVYAGANLLSMLVAYPLASRAGAVAATVGGSLLSIAGLATLGLTPRGSFTWALVGIVVTALGYGVLKSAVDTAIVTTTEGEARTGIYSLANLLSSVLGIGAGFLSGMLYARSPRLLYALSFGLVAAIPLCFGFASLAGRAMGAVSRIRGRC